MKAANQEAVGGDAGRAVLDGKESAACDNPNLPVLAELPIKSGRSGPDAATVGFDSLQEEPAVVCINYDQVESGWVALNRLVVATPNDFPSGATRVQTRFNVQAGWNQLGGIVAGKPGSKFQIRIVSDREATADGEQPDGGTENGSDAATPKSGGCGLTATGLSFPVLVPIVLLLLARRRRAE